MSFMDRYSRKVYRNVAASVGLDLTDKDESDAQFFTVDARAVRCSHCGGEAFVKYELGEGLPVQALECTACGHLELFSGRQPVEAEK